MRSLFRWKKVRHPFFPGIAVTAAGHAKGSVDAIAGTFEELYQAGCRPARARRAIFILTPVHQLLSDYDRDYLWDLLQVPTYALLTDRNGTIVGWECEAQDGFHIAGDSREVTCACGRPGVKIYTRTLEPGAASMPPALRLQVPASA